MDLPSGLDILEPDALAVDIQGKSDVTQSCDLFRLGAGEIILSPNGMADQNGRPPILGRVVINQMPFQLQTIIKISDFL